ncbi:MAG: hypothetical protein AAFQ41_06160 [Cyanobacteria bacterium J06623_7]
MVNTRSVTKKLTQAPLYQQNKHKIKYVYNNINYFSLRRSPLQHFVLIARGRSGSTCLLDILSCHPQILTDPHTFFNYDKLPIDFPHRKPVYSSKNVRGYKFSTQPKNMEQNAANAKIARYKLEALINAGVSLVYLERSNVVKRAISSLVAKSRKQFNYRKNERLEALPPVNITPEALLGHMDYCHQQNVFDRSIIQDLPHIGLNYEQNLADEADHQDALDKICQFLGITSAPAVTRLSKVLPNSIDEYIANPEELKSTIANSNYAKYLGEIA